MYSFNILLCGIFLCICFRLMPGVAGVFISKTKGAGIGLFFIFILLVLLWVYRTQVKKLYIRMCEYWSGLSDTQKFILILGLVGLAVLLIRWLWWGRGWGLWFRLMSPRLWGIYDWFMNMGGSSSKSRGASSTTKRKKKGKSGKFSEFPDVEGDYFTRRAKKKVVLVCVKGDGTVVKVGTCQYGPDVITRIRNSSTFSSPVRVTGQVLTGPDTQFGRKFLRAWGFSKDILTRGPEGVQYNYIKDWTLRVCVERFHKDGTCETVGTWTIADNVTLGNPRVQELLKILKDNDPKVTCRVESFTRYNVLPYYKFKLDYFPEEPNE